MKIQEVLSLLGLGEISAAFVNYAELEKTRRVKEERGGIPTCTPPVHSGTSFWVLWVLRFH